LHFRSISARSRRPSQQGQDAFVLGWLIALNENEVNAAMVAEQKAATAEQPKLSESRRLRTHS
jgi:hypothetical protein